MGNYLHTFVLEKKPATHRGRPGGAKRTHPKLSYMYIITKHRIQMIAYNNILKNYQIYILKIIAHIQFIAHRLQFIADMKRT